MSLERFQLHMSRQNNNVEDYIEQIEYYRGRLREYESDVRILFIFILIINNETISK